MLATFFFEAKLDLAMLERFTVGKHTGEYNDSSGRIGGMAIYEEVVMRPLSNDLRERIVAAVRLGKYSLRQLAEVFVVNLSTIVRLLQRYRTTGSVRLKPHAGGTERKLDANAEAPWP